MIPLHRGDDPVFEEYMPVTLWDDLPVVLKPDRIKVRRHVAYR